MSPSLPFSASRVVKASLALTAAEKLLWLEMQPLDSPTEGCWLSHEACAARLGLQPESLRQMRYRLAGLGLLEQVHRPGCRSVGWHVLLPPTAIPSPRPSPREVELLAAELDAHVRTERGRPSAVTRQLHESGMVIPPPVNGQLQTPSTTQDGGELGGRREDRSHPPSSEMRQHPLRPLEQQEGAFAVANARKGRTESVGAILRRSGLSPEQAAPGPRP